MMFWGCFSAIKKIIEKENKQIQQTQNPEVWLADSVHISKIGFSEKLETNVV